MLMGRDREGDLTWPHHLHLKLYLWPVFFLRFLSVNQTFLRENDGHWLSDEKTVTILYISQRCILLDTLTSWIISISNHIKKVSLIIEWLAFTQYDVVPSGDLWTDDLDRVNPACQMTNTFTLRLAIFALHVDLFKCDRSINEIRVWRWKRGAGDDWVHLISKPSDNWIWHVKVTK